MKNHWLIHPDLMYLISFNKIFQLQMILKQIIVYQPDFLT